MRQSQIKPFDPLIGSVQSIDIKIIDKTQKLATLAAPRSSHYNGVWIKCVEVTNAPLKANCSRQQWFIIWLSDVQFRLRDTFLLLRKGTLGGVRY